MKRRFAIVFFLALFVILLMAIQSRLQSGYESGELGSTTVSPVKDGEGSQPQATPPGQATPGATTPAPQSTAASGGAVDEDGYSPGTFTAPKGQPINTSGDKKSAAGSK